MSPFPASRSEDFDMQMVVVDYLTKDYYIIPCHSTTTAADLARLFVWEVWKLHSLPDSVVSDRGTLFVSDFWKAVCSILKIKVLLSTAYHPETDGQTERMNKSIAQYLRHYVSFTQKDWAKYLPLAEFTMRNTVNASTSISPFFANNSYYPRLSFSSP